MGKPERSEIDLQVAIQPFIRFVTAASLFDGHDAAINIMRRILQNQGVEVIHLGHNRSVEQVVNAALQEDVHGIAISSYQGGHVEYLKYMLDMLRDRGGEKIRIFAGGGGVIVPEEKRMLEEYGITRIYTPEDGQQLGLTGMIENTIALSSFDLCADAPKTLEEVSKGDFRILAQALTAIENGEASSTLVEDIDIRTNVPVLGITGTGGAGKSSLTDELDSNSRQRLGNSGASPRHDPFVPMCRI